MRFLSRFRQLPALVPPVSHASLSSCENPQQLLYFLRKNEQFCWAFGTKSSQTNEFFHKQ